MKILFLTQYYPPETGAPQNRLSELAVRLQNQGAEITVLTAMPNYPKGRVFDGYQNSFYRKEMIDGIDIYRSWIFASTSKSVVVRLLNYFSFVCSSALVGLFIPKRFNFILCESPPLFLGLSALWLCFWKRAGLIFNVSDLWPESAEKLGIVTNKRVLAIATILENHLYSKSVLITGQTQGICANIQKRNPSKRIFWLRNGVDTAYYNPTKFDKQALRAVLGFAETDLLFLYAGILGHAQGLELIIETAKRVSDLPNVKFIILGDGPEKEKLQQLNKDYSNKNVFFLESISKAEMPNMIAVSDAAIIPLKKLDLFLGAIPSKIFENLSMKKPILLGVDGEAKQLFIEEGNSGWYFEPENYKALALLINQIAENPNLLIEKGNNAFNYVKQKFERDRIALEFYNELDILQDS